MVKKPQDQELWELVKASVTPLKKSHKVDKTPLRKEPQKGVSPQKKILSDLSFMPQTSKQSLSSHLDRSTESKLKKGNYPIDRKIDLHGMTQIKAHRFLLQALETSYEQGHRCLLIVTGKGNPDKGTGVIKSSLASWLETSALSPYILKLTPAHISHGGAGAFYLLLKRKR